MLLNLKLLFAIAIAALLCVIVEAKPKPHLLAAAPVGYATPAWFAAAAPATPIAAAAYYPAYAAYTPIYNAYATYPYYTYLRR